MLVGFRSQNVLDIRHQISYMTVGLNHKMNMSLLFNTKSVSKVWAKLKLMETCSQWDNPLSSLETQTPWLRIPELLPQAQILISHISSDHTQQWVRLDPQSAHIIEAGDTCQGLFLFPVELVLCPWPARVDSVWALYCCHQAHVVLESMQPARRFPETVFRLCYCWLADRLSAQMGNGNTKKHKTKIMSLGQKA